MSWPDGYAQVRVTGAWFDFQNVPMVGSITIEPDREIYDLTGKKIVPPAIKGIPFVNGAISEFLLATNDSNVSPQGWSYRVTVNTLGGGVFYLEVDKDAGEIDITDWRNFQTGPSNGVTSVACASLTALNNEIAARSAKDAQQDAAIAAAGGAGALIASNNLSDLDDAMSAVDNLGLGTAALADDTDFDAAGAASAALISAKAYTDANAGGANHQIFDEWWVDGDTTLSVGLSWDVEKMPSGNPLSVMFPAQVGDVVTFEPSFMRTGTDAYIDFAFVSEDLATIYYYLGSPDGSVLPEGNPLYYPQAGGFPAAVGEKRYVVQAGWISGTGNVTIAMVSSHGGNEKIYSSAGYPGYGIVHRYRGI